VQNAKGYWAGFGVVALLLLALPQLVRPPVPHAGFYAMARTSLERSCPTVAEATKPRDLGNTVPAVKPAVQIGQVGELMRCAARASGNDRAFLYYRAAATLNETFRDTDTDSQRRETLQRQRQIASLGRRAVSNNPELAEMLTPYQR